MLIVGASSRLCRGTSQGGRCSTNSACGCFQMEGATNVGICGFTYVTCSELVSCASSNNECFEPGHICVRHECHTFPVCYPVSMTDQETCPPLTTMNTTTATTATTTSVTVSPVNDQLITSLVFNSMSLIPSTTERKVILSASITIKINSSLGHQSPLNIDNMEMNVSFQYEGDSVGMLHVSQTSIKQLDATTYELQFDNKYLVLTETGATYEKFIRNFINANKTHPVDFRIVGVASIIGSSTLGPLNIDRILVSNNVSLIGLDGLNNVFVHGISIDEGDGTALRFSIHTTIENPGVTNVQLQNVTFHIAEGENRTILGRVPISLLDIQPGNNEVTLNGLLAPSHETDLSALGKFLSAYLNGQTQSVLLFHDQSSEQNATAMDLTISDLSMKFNLNGNKTKLILRVDVLNFGIEFDPIVVNKVYVTGCLSVLFELPSNIRMTLHILTTSINFTLRFNDGANMGKMILHDLPVKHNRTTNEFIMCFDKQELIVLNDTVFKEFAADLFLTSNVSIMIEGLAAALVQTLIGNMTLSDIPISDTLHLVGYNQFENGLFNITEIDITSALSSHELTLRVKTQIQNPSVVNIINGNRLSLDLCDMMNGTSFGIVNIDPLYLNPQGSITALDAEGIFNITEENSVIAQKFISNMVSGIDSQVELRGTLADNATDSSIALLSSAIAGLRINTRVPGLSRERTLVQDIIVRKLTAAEIASIPIGLIKKLSIRVRLANPFSTPLTIHSMSIRADYGPIINEASQLAIVYDNTSLTVNGHDELVTDYISATILAKLTTLISFLGPLLSGNARLSLSGVINVSIGNSFVLNQLPFTILNVTTVQERSLKK